MAGKSWDKTLMPDGETPQRQWLIDNSHLYTVDEIIKATGRTHNSVYKMLRLLDLPYVGKKESMGDAEAMEQVVGIAIPTFLGFMKDKPRSLKEISQKFDRSEETIRQAIEQLLDRSYAITQTEAECHIWSTKTPPHIVAPSTILWDKDVYKFKFGVTSDWHDGSKAAQISARNKAVQIMYDEGVRDIIVAGDINAGNKVYRGQELDNVSMRPDHQAAITECYCPRYDGLKYHIMGGNHDFSFIVHGGNDALKNLCDRRNDFLWYGYDLVTVHITPDVDALVWHGTGSSAYALSYKSQKMVEQVAFQQLMEVIKKNASPKVRFLFAGHWHNIFMWYAKGPINVIHTGSFEGQNNLTRRVGWIDPHICAMIVTGEVTKDRSLIRRLKIEPLNFTEIEDDYLNYPVPREEQPEPEPLFQYTAGQEKLF